MGTVSCQDSEHPLPSEDTAKVFCTPSCDLQAQHNADYWASVIRFESKCSKFSDVKMLSTKLNAELPLGISISSTEQESRMLEVQGRYPEYIVLQKVPLCVCSL